MKLEKPLDAEYITIQQSYQEEKNTETNEEKKEEIEDDSFFGNLIEMTKDTLEEVGNKIVTIKKQMSGEIFPEKKIALIKLVNSSLESMAFEFVSCVVKGWGCQQKCSLLNFLLLILLEMF